MFSKETNRIILSQKRINTLLPLYHYDPYVINVVVVNEAPTPLPKKEIKVNNKLYSPFIGAKAPKLKNSFDNFTL
jgi:hypothetical protein